MKDCLFCTIVQGTIPGKIVWDDDATLAFLDIFPKAPGHTCVVLKRHGWGLGDYTTEDLARLMATVQRVTAALTKTFKTEVFTIGINHKEAQGVHHLHVHVLPRFPDDEGGVIQSIVDNPPKDDLDDIREQIVRNID